MSYDHFNYCRKIDADTVGMYNKNQVLLQVDDGTANTTTIKGMETTSDDLFIFANSTDSQPRMEMYGNAQIILNSKTRIDLYCATEYALQISISGTDTVLDTTVSNKNLFLNPHGTGKVKFGTHAGTGDVACNGNIPILDAGGNARKLMTTA